MKAEKKEKYYGHKDYLKDLGSHVALECFNRIEDLVYKNPKLKQKLTYAAFYMAAGMVALGFSTLVCIDRARIYKEKAKKVLTSKQ